MCSLWKFGWRCLTAKEGIRSRYHPPQFFKYSQWTSGTQQRTSAARLWPHNSRVHNTRQEVYLHLQQQEPKVWILSMEQPESLNDR